MIDSLQVHVSTRCYVTVMFTFQQNVNSIETEHGFVVTTHYYVTEEKRILIHTKKIKRDPKELM